MQEKPMRASRIAIAALAALVAVGGGCSDDDDPTGPIDEQEFVAQVDDFRTYKTWDRIDATTHPTNEDLLGPAHAGNSPLFARTVYKNNDEDPAKQAEYPMGTILVKETYGFDAQGNPDFTDGNVVGMAKRGGDFNEEHGGWEWFLLSPQGDEILDRGAGLMGGACNDCHTGATGSDGTDLVFAHPAEYAIPSGEEWTTFADGLDSWARVDSAYGPDPFLGQAHGVTGDFDREVFRWQDAGRAEDGRFPVGTTILKVVSTRGMGGERIYPDAGGWTAMVKRGGGFDPAHGDWEWFVLDPNTQTLSARGTGAEVMGGACTGCHSQATGTNGTDYVFSHPGLNN
ncbi:MAG: hypothetical protein GF346_10560 [Candidatus Eisenbacteria bacterium]|nr:hypothetical protein [Candidatus Latescibacterota bacterium]MBD3302878.1 hypothetical protein [Candidatus Eisenbacteria bacterium]